MIPYLIDPLFVGVIWRVQKFKLFMSRWEIKATCTMNVFPLYPGVSPIREVYSSLFKNTSRPFHTPRPVADVRPCIPESQNINSVIIVESK